MESISKRLGILEADKFCAKATFLDPRFKKATFGVESNANNTQEWIFHEIAYLIKSKSQTSQAEESATAVEVQSLNEKSDIWGFLDHKLQQISHSTSINGKVNSSADIELKRYLDLDYLPRTGCNPLKFWERNKTVFRHLYELLLKYLCIPATSVPSERLFSKAGKLITNRRNLLSGKNVNKLLFLNNNINIFDE